MNTPYNVGLPAAAAAAAFAPPIGWLANLGEAGSVMHLADGSEWLRTGVTTPYANLYASAATLAHLSVYGTQAATLLTAYQPNHMIASDGNGTLIHAFGSAAQVRRSTDGGRTWGTVSAALTGGQTITAVVWAGNRFVIGGTSVANSSFAYSLDLGVSWAPGTSTLGSAAAGVLHMAANPITGTVIAAASAGLGAGAVSRSVADATFVGVSAGVNSPGGTARPRVHFADGKFAVLGSDGAFVLFAISSDDGATFPGSYTLIASGGTGNSDVSFAGGNWIVSHTAGAYLTASDPSAAVNWTTRSFPASVAANNPAAGNLWHFSETAGGLVLVPHSTGFYFTEDGLRWKRSWLLETAAGTNGNWEVLDVGQGLLALNSASSGFVTGGYWISSLAQPDAIGYAQAVTTDAAAAAGVLYARVR